MSWRRHDYVGSTLRQERTHEGSAQARNVLEEIEAIVSVASFPEVPDFHNGDIGDDYRHVSFDVTAVRAR